MELLQIIIIKICYFLMIGDYNKKYNKVSKLNKSKQPSLRNLYGWRHYQIINVNKRNDKIELFAVCDKSIWVFTKKEDLRNIKNWKRVWGLKIEKKKLQ